MRITKEEKTLYRFLDIANRIIGHSSGRSYIIGCGSKLFFSTHFYCGLFVSHEDYGGIVSPYDFGDCEYELKKLPNGTYTLDRYELLLPEPEEKRIVIEKIHRSTELDIWCCEINKMYERKTAKIASTCGKWINDEDVCILKGFDSLDIYTNEQGLVIRNISVAADIYIAFDNVIVAPEGTEDSVQMKIEAFSNEEEEEGTIEPVEQIDAQNVSKKGAGDNYEYDDPMA